MNKMVFPVKKKKEPQTNLSVFGQSKTKDVSIPILASTSQQSQALTPFEQTAREVLNPVIRSEATPSTGGKPVTVSSSRARTPFEQTAYEVLNPVTQSQAPLPVQPQITESASGVSRSQSTGTPQDVFNQIDNPLQTVDGRAATPEELGYTKNGVGLYEKDGRLYVEKNGQLLNVAAGLGGAGLIGTTPASAVGGLEGILKTLKIAKRTREATTTLAAAEAAGTRIANAGGLVKVGSKFGPLSKTVTNTKEAGMINNFILNTAAKISPTNWKKLIGFGTGLATVAGTTAGISLWSGFGVRNSYSDGQQQLGIMISNAYKDGNIELGDELQALADDRTALYNELNPIWSNPWEAAKQILVFKDTVSEANAKVREDAIAKQEQAQANEQLIAELRQKLLDGTAQPGDQETLNELTGDNFQTQDDFTDQLEAKRKQALNDIDRSLIDRIINDSMTAQQIIDDVDIRAFALDQANQFSATTDIYNQALAAVARGNFNGINSGSSNGFGYEIEPPSTLGFGLLQTGDEFKQDEPVDDGQLIPPQTRNERALELYGLRYEQLTEAQKATVQ